MCSHIFRDPKTYDSLFLSYLHWPLCVQFLCPGVGFLTTKSTNASELKRLDITRWHLCKWTNLDPKLGTTSFCKEGWMQFIQRQASFFWEKFYTQILVSKRPKINDRKIKTELHVWQMGVLSTWPHSSNAPRSAGSLRKVVGRTPKTCCQNHRIGARASCLKVPRRQNTSLVLWKDCLVPITILSQTSDRQ